MRIALFSPVWFPVPPDRYGGIEAVVQLLADGRVDAGIDVTLFASGDSKTKARRFLDFRQGAQRTHRTELLGAPASAPVPPAQRRIRPRPRPLGPPRADGTRADFMPCASSGPGPLAGDPGPVYRAVCKTVPDAGLVSLRSAGPVQSYRGSRTSTTRSMSRATPSNGARATHFSSSAA